MSPRLAVLTTGRQDYGIVRPVCEALCQGSTWTPELLVGGLHLGPHRETFRASVERDGFPVASELAGTDSAGAAQAAAMVVASANALERLRPDALLLVGDRSETAAAAIGATLARVPIVHLHGGEETEGAIDNALRHAVTKLSHLHLVSHELHARRVRQMGEDPRDVVVVGAPGLDNIRRQDLPSRDALSADLGIALDAPVVVVTFHPTTLGGEPGFEVARLVDALERLDRATPSTFVVTLPNNDAGGEIVRRSLVEFARGPRRTAVEALGESRYFGLLRVADAMVGNSSSGLIEAPVVQLPVVDIGARQAGRLAGQNVIHAEVEVDAIVDGLRRALDPVFRAGLVGTTSPYGDGRSAARVRAALEAWSPPRPPRKRFHEGAPCAA